MADELTAEVIEDDEDPRPAGALTRPDAVALAENSLRDRLYDKVMPSMHALVSAHEVGLATTEPPEDWVEQFGEEQAKHMLRLAQIAYQPRRSVPFFVTAILDTYNGLERARAADKMVSRPVAVQVNIGMQASPLPVLEVRKDDDGG